VESLYRKEEKGDRRMSDKRKYRITVSLQQTEFEVDAVDDLDAEEQVNRIMLDGYDIWQFDEIELVDGED
jgi:hypothetical protein